MVEKPPISEETPKDLNNKSISPPTSSGNNSTVPQPRALRILVLGPQGCGKSSLINLAHGQSVQEISTGFELSTTKFHSTKLTSGTMNFTLVDSPGFDNASMSDCEIFSKLVQYLCCGKSSLKLAGVIYIHPEGSSLGGGALRRNLRTLKHLLGSDYLNRITFLLVPRSSGQLNHEQLIRPLSDPKSPFAEMCAAGAKIEVSQLETEPIRNILLHYSKTTPELVQVHREYLAGRIKDIKHYIEGHLQGKESTVVGSKSTRYPSQTPLGSKAGTAQHDSIDLKRLQLELAASNSRVDELNVQLQQTRAEYSSLRSQLQIHENIEQSQVIQDLVDLNRRIDDFGHSYSQHLVDKYTNPSSTSKDALQLEELQKIFGHVDGKASLIQSSTGVGMPLDDFLDLAARSILCEHLCKRIFLPFHPMISMQDPKNAYTQKLYNKVREQDPQPTAGRWRAAAFDAISRAVGPDEMSKLKAQLAHDILNESIMHLSNCFFSPKKKVELTSKHIEDLKELVSMAWEWNIFLKGKVILLGDFHPMSYRYSCDFDTQVMSEFEPMRGSQAPTRSLSTIGIGLNVTHAQGDGKAPVRTIIRKASVVSERRFEK